MPLDNVGGVTLSNFGVSLLNSVVYDELANQERIKQAWLAYQGEMTESLRVTRDRQTGFLVDDNVPINFIRTIVNVGADYLFGKEVGFAAGHDVTEQESQATTEPSVEHGQELTPEEIYLNAVWAANKKKLTLRKLAINGGICGTAFVKIVPRDDEGLPPRLVVLDPQTVSASWAYDDIDDVNAYKIEFITQNPDTNRVRIIQQRIERDEATKAFWTIQNFVSSEEHAPIFTASFSNVWPGVVWIPISPAVEWPFKWAPIVEVQNMPMPNVYWGEADATIDIMRLNDVSNSIVSNINRIIRLHAHPKTWTAGMSKRQLQALDVSIDQIIQLPSPDQTLNNLEMKSDLQAALESYRLVRKAIHEISQIPEVVTQFDENISNLSAVAMHILYEPLLQRTSAKRDTYGDMLNELNRRLLDLGKIGAGYGSNVDLRWPELLPHDPLVERQVFQIDATFGVSDETILEKLGYDPELEQTRMQAQHAQDMQQQEEQLTMQAAHQAAVAKLVGPDGRPVQGGGPGPGQKGNADTHTSTSTRTGTTGPRGS